VVGVQGKCLGPTSPQGFIAVPRDPTIEVDPLPGSGLLPRTVTITPDTKEVTLDRDERNAATSKQCWMPRSYGIQCCSPCGSQCCYNPCGSCCSRCCPPPCCWQDCCTPCRIRCCESGPGMEPVVINSADPRY